MLVGMDVMEAHVGLIFHTPALLAQAFTHPLSQERLGEDIPDQARLAVLGEATLSAGMAMLLHRCCPALSPDSARLVRQAVESTSFLADLARKWELGRMLRLPNELVREGARDQDQLLATAFRALIGAVLLDQGLEPVLRLLAKRCPLVLRYPELFHPLDNPKTELLRLVQKQMLHPPEYKEIVSWGLAHRPTYKLGLYVDGLLLEQGEGSSRRDAEAEVARKALIRLRIELTQKAEGRRDAAAGIAPEPSPLRIPNPAGVPGLIDFLSPAYKRRATQAVADGTSDGTSDGRTSGEAPSPQDSDTTSSPEDAQDTTHPAPTDPSQATEHELDVYPQLDTLLLRTARGTVPLDDALVGVIDAVQPTSAFSDAEWATLAPVEASDLRPWEVNDEGPGAHRSAIKPGKIENEIMNAKGILLERFARRRRKPEFRIERETGPAHSRCFTVGIYMDGQRVAGAEGPTRKEAEQTAARLYLAELSNR